MRGSTFFLTFLLLSLATSTSAIEGLKCYSCVENFELSPAQVNPSGNDLPPHYATYAGLMIRNSTLGYEHDLMVCTLYAGDSLRKWQPVGSCDGKCGVMTTTGNRNGKPYREIDRTCFPVEALTKWGLSMDKPDCKNISKFAVLDNFDRPQGVRAEKTESYTYSNIEIDMCWCDGSKCNDCLSDVCRSNSNGGGERSRSSWVSIFLGVVMVGLTASIISW